MLRFHDNENVHLVFMASDCSFLSRIYDRMEYFDDYNSSAPMFSSTSDETILATAKLTPILLIICSLV